jgi:hypothetical protein
MCRPKTNAGRLIARAVATIGLAVWLGGCSDVYWDHRETADLSGGDAIAANEMTQMVDPWPPNSGNKNIPYNGQKMQVAVERYRTGTVIPPVSAVTSDAIVQSQAAAPALPAAGTATQSAASGTPAATTAAQ